MVININKIRNTLPIKDPHLITPNMVKVSKPTEINQKMTTMNFIKNMTLEERTSPKMVTRKLNILPMVEPDK